MLQKIRRRNLVKPMTQKAKILTICAVVLVAAAAAAVKWGFFPSIKDAYFTMSQRALDQVLAGVVFVRPTHFPKSSRQGIMSDNVEMGGKRVWRLMGRNVTFQQLIAVAYGRGQARVVVPVGAPKINFDFLDTMSADQQTHLQTAIRKKLGYVAQTEKREVNVLALKIGNGDLPGLTVSDANTKENVNFDKGKLYFTHMRLQDLTGGLEQALKTPVVDRTSLTNFYDFSVSWDAQMQRQLNNEATAAAAVKKVLDSWGLRLEPDSDEVEMLVVRSAS
jgi:uncharacterized protein (TIGR03435 family)